MMVGRRLPPMPAAFNAFFSAATVGLPFHREAEAALVQHG
jgi:hypothetical protein